MTTKQSILGIDIGGTKILIGEVDLAGNVLQSKSYPSDTTSQQTVVKTLLVALQDYRDTIGFQSNNLLAAGVGVVGRVDSANGIWLEIQPGKTVPTPLADILGDFLGLPVVIENDVAAATAAEQRLGVGKETKDFIYINVGTGIAAGTVIDGKIVTGGHFNAGEIGHMVVDLESEIPCGCGRKGCVERNASGLGLSEQIYGNVTKYPSTSLPVHTNERIAADVIFRAAKKVIHWRRLSLTTLPRAWLL
ncbi:hypothetical protein LMUR_14846 [Listeria grayi FSL F6-1183]|uniref:ROK family protein n=1 Tax=Listeria grayi FSL F6-1183 TaxID=1265827 RepID=A0A829R1Z1_LISGR|nr:hypothetical protein LMUR_14846 [Listeria grayi FSL F6-1183]